MRSDCPALAAMSVPAAFVWTRFGTEAGEPIADILARKERERAANDGVFWWGIGNSVGRAVSFLVRDGLPVRALFSPIVGPARQVDASPVGTVRWARAEDWLGFPVKMPAHTVVTSRGGRSFHYALVCHSSAALSLADEGALIYAGSLANLESGNPVGASQTTAVVRRDERQTGRGYVVAMNFELVPPYFVRLTKFEQQG